MLRAISDSFGPQAFIDGQGAGLHVVLQLPGASCSETEIISRAQQKGIYLFPFTRTCASGESDTTKIMLGFGGTTTSEIEEGVALLAKVCF